MRKMSDDLLMEIKAFIENFVETNDYSPSVRDVCDGLSIKSTATAFKYIQKLSDLGHLVKVSKITRALQVTNKLKRSDFNEIPCIGKIAAGEPITAVENIDESYLLPSKLFGDGNFMLTIQGNSMVDAGILNGDKVVIQQCSTAENGEIVAAMVEDSATVKRFYKEDGFYRLHPENSTMDDIIVDSCEIIGKVVGVIRRY